MVCVDPVMSCIPNRNWRWNEACHLFTDDGNLDDLHAFAARVGLRRAWFQRHACLPHYDLTIARRGVAVRLGARQVDRAFVAGVIKANREKAAAA